MQTAPWALIRADASAQIGSGHVMRCLALAEAFAALNIHTRFACKPLIGNLQSELVARGYEVLTLPLPEARPFENVPTAHVQEASDALETLDAVPCDAAPPSWVVVDHYGLGKDWHQIIRNSWRHTTLAAVDDLADRPLAAHLVINQNATREIHAHYSQRVGAECRLLLGPAYTLLRTEFAVAFEARNRCTAKPAEPGPVIVFMGGADLAGLTLQLLTTTNLSLLPGSVHVLIGSMNPKRAEIEQHCHIKQIPCDVASHNVGRHLVHACGAIVACGMFAVELQALGVPSVLIPLSDIQRTVATYFSAHGWACVVEPETLCEPLSWRSSAAFLSKSASNSTVRRVAIPLDGAASVVKEMTKDVL